MFSRLKRNKKGVMSDVLTIGEFVLRLGFIAFITAAFLIPFISNMTSKQADGEYLYKDNDTRLAVAGFATGAFTTFDNIFVVFIVGLTILLIISSFAVRTHKAFLIFNLAGMFFLLMIAYLNSFIFKNFASSPALIGYSSYFPKLSAVLMNYPWVCLVISVIAFLVMYGKPQSIGDGNV